MKFAILFGVCIAYATAAYLPAEQKRNAISDFFSKFNHQIIDIATLKKDLQIVLDTFGSNETEKNCEAEINKIATGLIQHSAPLVCHSFQSLVQHYHLVPDTAPAVGKRFFLDDAVAFLSKFMDTTTLRDRIQEMLDAVGSDPTEQACEAEGHNVFSGLADSAVPLLCRTFQSVVHQLNLKPDATTTAAGV